MGAGVLIVGSLVGVYLVVCLAGALPWYEQLTNGPAGPDLMEAGAKVNPWVKAGQWYRLATSPLLHGDPVHLLANGLCVAILVPFGVFLVGLGPTLACWMLGGIMGQVLSLVTGMGTSIGASGGVFALASMVGVCLVVQRPPRSTGRSLPWGLVCAVALGVSLAAGGEGVDQAAHAGGAMAGLTMGAVMLLRRTMERWITASVGVVGLLLAAQGALAPPLPLFPGEVRQIPVGPGLVLPQMGEKGVYVGAVCQRPEQTTTVSTPLCVTVPGEMISVAGETAAVLAADEVARAHCPPPGRCVRYTGEGEQVLLIRPDEGHLIALATRWHAWDRYADLRRALTRGRCPNR